MPCSRSSAIRRLLRSSRKTAADEDFGLRVSLSDALCDENVEVVRKLDLYPEYDAVTFPRRLDRRVACCDPRTFSSEA